MKTILVLLTLLFALLFQGCEADQPYHTIAANRWIGYLPFAYANEMGWLQKDHFILKWTNSLSESKTLFELGLCQGFCATQYEVLSAPHIKTKALPYFFIDQSLGADQILSNTSLQKLKKSPLIEVYLELSSVNKALLDSFIKRYHFKNDEIHLNDTTQDNIVQMKCTKPTLIVTYEPYATLLRQQGFFVVASSKTLNSVIRVYDLFFALSTLPPQKVRPLYESFLKGVRELQERPRYFYEIIKDYIPHISYEKFRQQIKGIRWIEKPTASDIDYLKAQGFDLSHLLTHR